MAVWMITGAGRGFGHEIALAAARAGHEVVATMRRPDCADPRLLTLRNVITPTLDVTDPDSIARAVEEAIGEFGTIDVLVNNAGRGMLGAIESTTDEELRGLYELNVFALVAVTRHVLPIMRSADHGHIVNIGSMGGIAAFAGTGAYASTKFAVEGLSEAMRDELSHTRVKVTVVEPGSFRTDFMDASSMTVASGPTFAEYDATVNSMVERHLATNGSQPGDPVAAAAAILKLVRHEDPPTHLLLGRDAVARAEAKLASIARELEQWRGISLSTDYDC